MEDYSQRIEEVISLYRKDTNGKITVWRAYPSHIFTGEVKGSYTIEHGKVDGKIRKEIVYTNRKIEDEIASKYKIKIKQGYKSIADIKDNIQSPVKEDDIIAFLKTYLPETRTTEDGSLLAMLAKVYDNTNNKIFKDNIVYLGQWKINGLRCFIRATKVTDNMFESVKFTFQSREGTYWNSLDYLSDYLLNTLSHEVVDHMLYDDWILDGELYIPGFSINELNHHIKNINSPYNKFVQFWCYDIAVPDTIQYYRNEYLLRYFYPYILNNINNKEDHLNVKSLFNVLPNVGIYSDYTATNFRNHFIDLGFEGLIMRNPILEYEYGKRKMIKYKKATDGIFTIIDVIPEGIKRSDIAKFVCKNDINDNTFECKLSASLDFQRACLKHKNKLIGEQLFIEYGERSGINNLPFHLKTVRFKNLMIYSKFT